MYFKKYASREVKVTTKTKLVVDEVVQGKSEMLGELANAQKELEEVNKRIEKN